MRRNCSDNRNHLCRPTFKLFDKIDEVLKVHIKIYRIIGILFIKCYLMKVRIVEKLLQIPQLRCEPPAYRIVNAAYAGWRPRLINMNIGFGLRRQCKPMNTINRLQVMC